MPCHRFQKPVLREAFFGDLSRQVAKPILPGATLALPEKGEPLLAKPRPPSPVQDGETVAHTLASCMFRLQWPGEGPDRAGDPEVAGLLL